MHCAATGLHCDPNNVWGDVPLHLKFDAHPSIANWLSLLYLTQTLMIVVGPYSTMVERCIYDH